MQTERRVAANPQTKPTDLSRESAENWLLPSTVTITIYYYYSARKLILMLPSRERLKGRVDLGTAAELHNPCPRLYIAVAVMINTARDEICLLYTSPSPRDS